MELQAIRYAAMVSSMTMDQAVAAHAATLKSDSAVEDARKAIADYLGVSTIDETALASDVRIVLVAANFSSEITTAVIWLNQRDLDIRCVRLRPYKMGGQLLIDATQILPLPEAADYAVKIKEKDQEAKKVKGKRQELLRKFWTQLIERSIGKTALFEKRTPTTDHWLSAGIGRSGFSLNVSMAEDRTRVEIFIQLPKTEQSKAAFKALEAQKQQLEAATGGALDWELLEHRSGCRISRETTAGGWKSPEPEWPTLIDWAIEQSIAFEKAFKPAIAVIKSST